jgi:hypothetical protein
MITGTCLVTSRWPIETVLEATPFGGRAMFEVVCARDDSALGEMVYIKDGKAYSCMDDERVRAVVTADQLAFKAYIKG